MAQYSVVRICHINQYACNNEDIFSEWLSSNCEANASENSKKCFHESNAIRQYKLRYRNEKIEQVQRCDWLIGSTTGQIKQYSFNIEN